MNKPTITARHETESITTRTMIGHTTVYAGAELVVTFEQGDTAGALAALDKAYDDVKHQITGMTTLVHGERAED